MYINIYSTEVKCALIIKSSLSASHTTSQRLSSSLCAGCRSGEAWHLHQVCCQRRSSRRGSYKDRSWNLGVQLTRRRRERLTVLCVFVYAGRSIGCRRPAAERGRAQSGRLVAGEVTGAATITVTELATRESCHAIHLC